MLRTIGFVLKKTNIGEFDRGYCFFTKKYGKINLTARSVKKPLSKLSGQLEPPSLVSFVFTPMGNGGLLTTALAKKSFLNIRRDYDRLRIYQS
jgi:DNA repair protein RecO